MSSLTIPFRLELRRGLRADLPADGLISEPYFCLDTGELFVWDGTEMVAISGTGPAGPAGADGHDGSDGSDGAPGADGATWTSGSGVPSNGSGQDGDFYFRTTTSDVYEKASGSWSIIANIKGAAGNDGATGASGPAGPAPSGTPNQVVATDASGSSTNPAALRVLVVADIPALPESKITNLTADLAARPLLVNFMGHVIPLTGAKYVNGQVTTTLPGAGANTVLYTCPAGKRAIVFEATAQNNTVATASNYQPQFRPGSRYPTNGAQVCNGITSPKAQFAIGIIMDAGDVLEMQNVQNAGSNNFTNILEFDVSNPIKTARIFSDGVTTAPNSGKIVNGAAAIYTVPAGKTALVAALTSAIVPDTGGIKFFNASGGTRVYKINVIPSGGSIGDANQYDRISSGNLATAQAMAIGGLSLNAGDTLSVIGDSNAAGQLIVVSYLEF